MRSLIVSLITVVLMGDAFVAPAADANPWVARRVLNMAHRGGRAEAPEHTMYAYKTALAKGATTLEVDVYLSIDGELVVHHDGTVDRVTNGEGPVSSFTLAELKALDNAYWFSPLCGGNCRGQAPEDYVFRGVATGERPPPAGSEAGDFQILTMREVLQRFPQVLLSIEIKGGAPESVPAAEALAAMLREFGREDDVLIASFDDATTDAFKAVAPEIHTTPGLNEIVEFVGTPGPLPNHRAFQIPRTFEDALIPPLIVEEAHSNDLAVYVFINPSEENPDVYNELIDQGVDGIITDHPTALQAVLDERDVSFEPTALVSTKNLRISVEPRVKFLSKSELKLPLVAPEQTLNSVMISNNGGVLMDSLQVGAWKSLGRRRRPKGYRYTNEGAPDGGACRTVVIKRNGIKIVCLEKGTIPAPATAGSNGDIHVTLALGANLYCGGSAAPHDKEVADRFVRATLRPAPSSCSLP